MSDQDWRLTGQEQFLAGATLVRRAWRESRPGWDHDHCEFCWEKFSDIPTIEAIREGWTTADEYHWICDGCFHDFNDRFNWRTDALEPGDAAP
jgi:hypothetical protein